MGNSNGHSGKEAKDEIRICVDLKNLNNACVHGPFSTPFTNEVQDNAREQETYSFTDGFFGYHQINIMLEDRSKTTFTMEWGFFQYMVIPFRHKNAPDIFSRVVITKFKEFIHKFLEVYFDDWTVFGLVRNQVVNLCLMLDTCQRFQITLNLKKCTFLVPFGNLLWHVVCK